MLLVDVDGVLSLYGAARAEPGTLVGCLVDGVPHLLSRRAATVLDGLIEDFECAWCTGWEERADEHLPGLLLQPDPPSGLPQFSSVGVQLEDVKSDPHRRLPDAIAGQGV